MKLFAKFRQSLIKERKLKRYLIYAIGEILLVMIGILLAFQVNKWNDNRLNRNAEIAYYENLRSQINEDKRLINGEISHNKLNKGQYEYASQIIKQGDRTKMDTLGKIINVLTDYSDFDREGNIYETLVNSGEIKLLKNQSIVDGIRKLEEKYNYLNRMENIHYDVIGSYVIPTTNSIVNFYEGTIENSEPVFNYQFRNLIGQLIMIMDEKEQTYLSAVSEIESIVKLIDEELTSD